MLKFFACLLVLFSACYRNAIKSEAYLNCLLLKQFFEEEDFYKLNSIRLAYADTITVIDAKGYFTDCNIKTINNKFIVIKKVDDFTYGDFRKMLKYRYYFTIYDISKKGNDIVKIAFEKKMSNHKGFFEYKISGKTLIKVNQEIGQY